MRRRLQAPTLQKQVRTSIVGILGVKDHYQQAISGTQGTIADTPKSKRKQCSGCPSIKDIKSCRECVKCNAFLCGKCGYVVCPKSVSYTHLDVYKRQL